MSGRGVQRSVVCDTQIAAEPMYGDRHGLLLQKN
jgi:hypothetical protein